MDLYSASCIAGTLVFFGVLAYYIFKPVKRGPIPTNAEPRPYNSDEIGPE